MNQKRKGISLMDNEYRDRVIKLNAIKKDLGFSQPLTDTLRDCIDAGLVEWSDRKNKALNEETLD